MKLIPIKINSNTEYMVDLESDRTVNDSFLIHANNRVNLISFYRQTDSEQVTFQTDKGRRNMYVSFSKEDNVNSENDCDINRDIITIKLQKKRPNAEKVEAEKVETENYEYSFKSAELFYNPPQNHKPTHLEVKISYEDEETSKTLVFYLYRNRAEVYESVIDCGSEATQISFKCQYVPENVNNRISILKSILAMRNIQNENDVDYIQHENQSNYLFRSIFYVKNEITTDDIENVTPVYYTNNEEGNDDNYSIDNVSHILDNESFEDGAIKILTQRTELERGKLNESYFRLCNMKVSAFGGVSQKELLYNGLPQYVTGIGDNYYYRRYLNEFLHIVLEMFNRKTRENVGIKPRFLSLYMLMPNVYSLAKVQKCLDDMTRDISDMIEQNGEFKKNILGFTVNAVSESDASLIGADTLEGLDIDGVSLIMDAGKGTLDYSIIIKEQGKYINIMKGGIVGASAAISYGFILDLLTRYVYKRKTESAQNIGPVSLAAGINEIMKGSPKFLNELMSAVDEYKIRYDGLNPQIPVVNHNPAVETVFSYDAFVEWIKRLDYQVENRYVNAIINEIVTTVTEDINSKNSSNIDYVIFAGRGFLYKGLKDEMLRSVKSRYPNVKNKELDRNNAVGYKSLCLHICNAIAEGLYGYKLPDVYQEDVKTEKGGSRETFRQRLYDYFHKDFKFGKIQQKQQRERQIVKVNSSLATGWKLNKVNNNKTRVSIAGATYSIPYGNDDNAEIFIANGKIYLRSNRVVKELREVGNVVVTLAFPSLFPDCSSNEVYIPELNDLHDDANTPSDNNVESSSNETPKQGLPYVPDDDSDTNPWEGREEIMEESQDVENADTPNNCDNDNGNDDPFANR